MLFLFFCLLGAANAHSWVEQLTVIAPNGTFVGDPGYARGNVMRSTPGFSDTDMVNLLPPDGRSGGIQTNDAMCHPSQQTQTQTSGSPRLQAAAGAAIALRYQENGHVTLPQNQPGKPANRGTMYVYGTTQPKVNETFLSIHKVWNANGTGGDGRGVLLSTQSYDDSRCYQINGGNISVARQAQYPHEADELMGADMWCQQDLALPSNAPSGETYTLYWVWDWPTAAGVDPNLPEGKEEIYTTCMDVDITTNTQSKLEQVSEGYVSNQNLNSAAIPAEFSNLGATDVAATEAASSTSAAQGTTITMSNAATAVSSSAPCAPTETVTETGPLMPTSTVTVNLASTEVDTFTEIVTVTQTFTAGASGLARRSESVLAVVPVARSSTSSGKTPTTVMTLPSSLSTSSSFADSIAIVTVFVTSISTTSESASATSSADPTTTSVITVHVSGSAAPTASPTFRLRGRSPLLR